MLFVVPVYFNLNVDLSSQGIMTAEDAELACQNGVDGILVSNHGARQLDTVYATIEVGEHWLRASLRNRACFKSWFITSSSRRYLKLSQR